MASCAAEQGRFWEMHALLFEAPGTLSRQALIDRAEKLGLDRSAATSCLGRIGAHVGQHQAEGRRLGITATPTFLLGGVDASGILRVRRRLSGAYGYATFKAAIEALTPSRS
jgi:protein-disulfide isomerase